MNSNPVVPSAPQKPLSNQGLFHFDKLNDRISAPLDDRAALFEFTQFSLHYRDVFRLTLTLKLTLFLYTSYRVALLTFGILQQNNPERIEYE
jgi:hypothetical protein